MLLVRFGRKLGSEQAERHLGQIGMVSWCGLRLASRAEQLGKPESPRIVSLLSADLGPQ